MAKISTYPIISLPTFNDLLIGTDVNNLNETKNFTIGDIADLILVGSYVPYVGATTNVDLGIHSITASSFIVPGGLSTEFVKADGSLDSTVYQPAGNYITGLSGEATASGPGVSAVVLDNGAVIGKVLTGLTITGGSISSSDSILQAFGKLQNQVNSLYGGAIYQGTWNASTNTPTLTSGVGVQGYYYIVSVAGSTNLDGITDWNVGDWAIFDGTAWQQVDNTDTVVSVNGQVGIVVLTTTDIAEGTNLYYTDTRARAALTLTTTGSSGASTYNNLTGAFNIPNYTLSGLGGVPSTRELTINGTTYNLSADRSWSVGTVTSIGTSGPLTGGTITGIGTIGIAQSGVSTDGYLSSTDWNTFNNKQNALINPVTGTGTAYYIPMWSSATALTDSIISYSLNVINYNYNSASGATVNYINTNGTAYTYTIQMNNVGTRQTYHSYTDGNIIQRINSNDVSRNLQSGQLVLPYYTATGSFTGTSVGYLGFDASGNVLTVPVPSLTGYVPYTGATANVDLGTHRILAQNATIASNGSGDTFTLNHSSGSGIGLNITKGGSGEGLYVNKTSGSGNAATIIGTLNATTLVKSGGTSSQFLKADGSVDSTTYVGGSGTTGQVAYWNGTSSQTGSNNLFWDAANSRLGIGTNSPLSLLSVGSGATNFFGNATLSVRGGILFDSGAVAVNAGTASFGEFNFIGSKILLVNSSAGSVAGQINLQINRDSIQFDGGGGGNSASITRSTGSLILDGNHPTTGTLQFRTAGVEKARLFNTGNFILQNGGTFTDSGQRLQVQGTTFLNGNVNISGSTTATSGTAKGELNNATLVASANNDVLVGLDVNPTFTNGAFTGVSNLAIRATGWIFTTNYRTTSTNYQLQQIAIGRNDHVGAGTTGSNNISLGGFNGGGSSATGTSLTTGNDNVLIGYGTGGRIVTGGNNIAIGSRTLESISTSTASNNTAIGGGSLLKSSGNNNTAIGNGSASVLVAGGEAFLTGANNVYLGSNTKVLSNTETNVLVIGYNAQSLGSNTTVIGNSSTLTSAIYGNLLVGTTADQGYRVQITGSGDNMLNVWGATAPSIRLDNAASGATQRFVIGLATATNNFIQGASAGDVCITTATASPMVFGMWQTSTASEVMRITTSNNLLINKTTDGGQKLQVSGKVNFASLPTSSAGLSAGDIWNNGGVLNIV